MKKLAPWLVLLLALALCAWSAASAQETGGEPGEDSPTPPPDMPTPVPLEMPTPIPLTDEEEIAPNEEAPMPMPEITSAPEATPSPPRFSLEGQIAFKTAVDTEWDLENENVWSNDLNAFLSASGNWGRSYGAVVSGLFEYRYEVGEEARGEPIPELRELYGRVGAGPFDLFFGWQIVSWGVVDGVNPMDILNPWDYRRAIDIELDYARLPTFMVRPLFYAGPFTLEAVYIPLFTPPRFNVIGSNWALTGQHFPLNDVLVKLRTDRHWAQFERFISHWVPDWQDSVQRMFDDPDFYQDATDIPDQDLTAPEGAIRVSWRTRYVDTHVAYYALWDDIPTLHTNPVFRDLYKIYGQTDQGFAQLPPPDAVPPEDLSPAFTLTNHRVQSVGLGLSGLADDVGLRAEGRMDFNRYTYRTDLSLAQRNAATWVLNADYTFRGNLLVSGLLIQGYLFDREEDFLSRAWQNELGLIARRPFLDERLLVEFFGLVDFTYMRDRDWRRFDLTNSGWLVAPLVTYNITDPLRVSLGADLFGGRNATPLGSLERNNRVFALLRYGF